MKYYYVYHQVEGAFTEHVNCEGMLTEVLSKPLLMMKCFHEFQSSKTMNYHNTPKLIVHLSLLKKIPPIKLSHSLVKPFHLHHKTHASRL